MHKNTPNLSPKHSRVSQANSSSDRGFKKPPMEEGVLRWLLGWVRQWVRDVKSLKAKISSKPPMISQQEFERRQGNLLFEHGLLKKLLDKEEKEGRLNREELPKHDRGTLEELDELYGVLLGLQWKPPKGSP